MLEFVKKEMKFLILIGFILVLLFAVQTFAISPAQEKGANALRSAKRNGNEMRKIANKLFVDVYTPSSLPMVKPRDLSRKYKKEIADAQDDENVLQKIIAFRTEPRFRLPADIIERAEKEKQVRIYESYAEGTIRELLQEEYSNLEDYKFVKSPSLSSSTIENQLAFFEYVDYESAAFIGKDVSEGKMLDDLITARAKAELRLTLLNIVKVVLDSAKNTNLKIVQDLKFIPRPDSIAKRFKVKKQTPCYYRPVVMELSITAEETQLFDFVRTCIDPSPEGNPGQFLALHSFDLENADSLKSSMVCPQCKSNTPRNAMYCTKCHKKITSAFDLTARVQLIAFLIDPRFPLVKFEKQKKKAAPMRFGPRFYNRSFPSGR